MYKFSAEQILPGSFSGSFSGSFLGVNGQEIVSSPFAYTSSIDTDFYATTSELQVTGSLFISHNSSSAAFIVRVENSNGNKDKLIINSEGILQLGEFNNAPTPVSGSIIYSGSQFYLGL